MIVMKFGGSSVADASRMRHVANIVQFFAKENKIVVVVSAMAGVTDTLISIFNQYASKNAGNASNQLMSLYEMHMQTAEKLHLDAAHKKQIKACLNDLFRQLQTYLSSCRDFSETDYAYVVSFGERFSSCLVATALDEAGEKAQAVDASELIVALGTPLDGKADIEATEMRTRSALQPLFANHIIPVVTGFFAASKQGQVMTLGRGGSDYSATILAHALDAKEVILWKEVDGVYTGDPKKDASAQFYPQLSYEQALSLAKQGAKILHPEAMKPVADKNIIVWVKNTFKPGNPGTKIWRENA